MVRKFEPIKSPFGNGIDEQATTAAFEEFVGGVSRAQRLFGIYKNSYPSASWGFSGKGFSKVEVFSRKALADGFNQQEIDAFFSLQ